MALKENMKNTVICITLSRFSVLAFGNLLPGSKQPTRINPKKKSVNMLYFKNKTKDLKRY